MPTEKEILQLQYDKQQMQFAIDGSIIINKKVIDEQTPLTALINKSNYWICPFCLVLSNNFTIENKGLIVCNNCLIGMRLKTLLFIKDCSNIEYANWVFNYRLSGFFAKLKSGNNSFEKWNKKMKDNGMSYEFWEEYKKLKGENTETPLNSQKEFSDYIDLLVLQIYSGLSKNEIIKESYNFNFTDAQFHYCYNEAELRIKNKVV